MALTALTAAPVPWAPRAVLGESARWHDGRWWWIDAADGTVYSHRPGDGQALPWLNLGRAVSLVHPAPPAGMLVAAGNTLSIYADEIDPDGTHRGRWKRDLAALDLPDGWTLNDGTGAPGGGAYIGVVSGQRDAGGYLCRVHGDGRRSVASRGVELSNGLAVDASRQVLYHADSRARHIVAHRIDSAGEIVSTSRHLSFRDSDGMPDGIAIDRADHLWVALYGAGEVRRYAPNGTLDLVVTVPTPQVTSVMIGGPDGLDLLITTAREGYDDLRSEAEPLAGKLFMARAPEGAGDLVTYRSCERPAEP